MIIDGKLVVSKKKKVALVQELQTLGFKRFPKVADARKSGEFEKVVDEDGDDEDAEIGSGDFDYLLGMAIWSLTRERVEKLLQQVGDKELEIDTLSKKSPKDIWTEDLDALQEEWKIQLEEEATRTKKTSAKIRRASAKFGIGAKSKKRKAYDSEADSDFDVAPKKKTTKSSMVTKVI